MNNIGTFNPDFAKPSRTIVPAFLFPINKNQRSFIPDSSKVENYGITSLSPTQASAKNLLALRRGHWTIENQSHYVRDVVLGEDASQVRSGVIPQVMSPLRNTALAVLRFVDYHCISQAMRYFAAHPQHALNLINQQN